MLCWMNLSQADSLKIKEVPSPLQPWVKWVLHDVDDYTCPFHYNQSPKSSSEQKLEKGICHWPSRLTLNVDTKQAEFNQEWQVYSAGWVALPGNTQHWPQNVQVNDTPAVVTDRDGVPNVFARKGLLKIQGQFQWEQRPEFLQIPNYTGLIALTVNNTPVTLPELDTMGRLWLQRGISDDQKAEQNRLDIRVYRLISDDIPLQLITQIELDVAGNHREVMLGPVMLDKHIAMSLNSALPARLESDGRLRVQLRPGSWTLTLRTRQEGVTNQLTLPSSKEQPKEWVNEEIWVFKAHNELRLTEIRGVSAIDPQQTALPSKWRKLPAYQIRVGDTLEFVEKRRGDPDPTPDQLYLKRHFWLDFDGKGYSVRDRVSGTMTRGWRLEMAPPALLGRVSVNGQDQFITRLAEEDNAGIEVRRGQINLVADIRLENAVTKLPAVGWAHDFQQVSAILHLPPGWRLFNATGVDDVPEMWLKQWNLLDLFIVLIMAVAVGKLWRWWWGFFTLITMMLLTHETGAPYGVWLNIIAALALLRVLPELGWFTRIVRGYRNLSLLALLIIAIPFMMQQARQSIYPQLEYPWERLDSTSFTDMSMEDEADWANSQSTSKMIRRGMELIPQQEESYILPRKTLSKKSSTEKQQLLQIDPNAQVQTGPGLPQWEWPGSIAMQWSGPVQQNQEIELWLLSPTVNSVLGWIRMVLLGILTAFFLWASFGQKARLKKPKTSFQEKSSLVNGATATVLLFGILFSLPMISHAQTSIEPSPELVEHSKIHSALELLEKSETPTSVSSPKHKTKRTMVTNFPPQPLLDELQKRLLASADCLPYCASSPRLLLELQPTQLRARMEIHSNADIAVPLPGLANQWLPQQVWLNDEPAQALSRHNGQLWLSVNKGIHQVQITGALPNRAVVQLPLPLKPHFVTVVNTQGWHVEGVHENGVADNQLQFTREQTDEVPLADLEMGSLPPFVQVERTLLLGVDWIVTTRVIRKTPLGSAIVLEIPLLQGESVMSDLIRVEDGKALINLSQNESEIGWSSVFEKQETITLTAPANTFNSEVWRLETSAIWHVDIDGIPVVHHQAQGRWLPKWRPWPGESVTLHLSRPKGVTGQVLTIDRSQLIVKPGQRTTDNQLFLNIRSSRGMQHKITLPEDAQLQSVKINNQSQPIHQEERIVTLPITPGAQRVELQFQQPIGMSQHFYTPNVDLGIDSVNTIVEINMPKERWILFTGGQAIGPAVMIWGILIVIVFVSVGLGQISLTPLNTFHWLLLGIVLSQVPVPLMLCVIAWFMALGWRANLSTNTLVNWKFNLIQLSLGILTLVALMTLLNAIHQGLLGHPNMHIAGNGSEASNLRWYEDRTAGILPQVWVVSLSMWIYRIAMLLWALWISFALIRWLRWGWECFSTNELWKPWRTIN